MNDRSWSRAASVDIATLAIVALGGAIGATARWGAGVRFDIAPDEFPWPTLAVNVVGCLLIGLVAARVVRDTRAWAFVVTGLLGGFTTMSAFAVELNDLVDENRTATAVVYLLVTLAGGAIAVTLGGRRER